MKDHMVSSSCCSNVVTADGIKNPHTVVGNDRSPARIMIRAPHPAQVPVVTIVVLAASGGSGLIPQKGHVSSIPPGILARHPRQDCVPIQLLCTTLYTSYGIKFNEVVPRGSYPSGMGTRLFIHGTRRYYMHWWNHHMISSSLPAAIISLSFAV